MSDKRDDLKSLFNSLTSLARKMKELMGDDDYILTIKHEQYQTGPVYQV